jgi:predicted TIM-barrel fold metal-dependent hydrolase
MEVVGRPCDTALTVARMIYSGTLDRHPALQVVTVHTGGAVPLPRGKTRPRLAAQLQGRRRPGGVEPYEQRNELEPSSYLRCNVWADTMGLCARCVRDAIEVYGIDHILFGTDYGPVPISPREHIDMVLALGLSSEDEEKILWRNADRSLRLDLGSTSDEQTEPGPLSSAARLHAAAAGELRSADAIVCRIVPVAAADA